MVEREVEVSEPKADRKVLEDEGLLKASGVTGSMTMFSRFLGLARDIVIARLFGATDASDASPSPASIIKGNLVCCLII